MHLGLCWVYVALDGEAATRDAGDATRDAGDATRNAGDATRDATGDATRDAGDATRDAQEMQPRMLYASKQGCAHLNKDALI